MIKPCPTCKPHPFQDSKYGSKNRVMNRTAKKDPQVFRCTVCSRETS